MNVNIRNTSTNVLPHYQTKGSAGMDICAFLEQPQSILPMERKLISTGIYIALPDGLEAQIRPRSGLALKQGITVLNSPGTIDSDYRGEIKIILINLSETTHQINNGDRIAQLVIAKYEKVNWQIVNELAITERNDGGFGHTGKQ